ncbi:glutamate--cysteine ligase [Oceanisphaera psychrotolerans]|uniref:Glutamate--cysteine ligase n=1 Tax=Oceanisphaera psychrotolerans TaxID=1414654 RepID=A0A1J4QDR7_9GAMM|nr:glutamate--cysteine ligase [Oceanisphaera psychrotolerans]OIN10355.1 glutamate--cysteine ligase [Oceanisphaera psychrotolerans]
MTKTTLTLAERIQAWQAPARLPAIKGIRRGIERESLRITPDGHLAQTGHPKVLGSALTHANITTDFSESLMEFITPVSDSVEILLAQLGDIHGYTMRHLGEEQLWPLSMPCLLKEDDRIPLAQYGSSNVGRMKTLYRQGLHHRYGSRMQVISGVHFNFSMPDSFWSEWHQLEGNGGCLQGFVSDKYLGLIRNVYRFGWLIPYLFGASPALCGSFLAGREHQLPFERLGKGTLYLPYATSLRLSDLGYTNSAQAGLNISLDSLDEYVSSLRRAIGTHAAEFARIGVKVDGEYRQLNDNVLQIENELYAPIRPKRTAESGEKPSEALATRGIEYIEVRSVDVNPFSAVGIDADQILFLDTFLLWCLLTPSAPLTEDEIALNRRNFNKVVLEGRKPGLELEVFGGETLTLKALGERYFGELKDVAALLDACCGRGCYGQAHAAQLAAIQDPSLTLSARVLNELKASDQDILPFGLALSKHYHQQLQQSPPRYWDDSYFDEEGVRSHARQRKIELSDTIGFDEFLQNYFGQ